MLRAQRGERRGRVLAASISVHNHTGDGAAARRDRHAQRIGDQAGLHLGLHAPAHHLPAEQVDHGRQIQPAFVGGDVRDVAAPDSVRLGRIEVSGQQVLRNWQTVPKLHFTPLVHWCVILHPVMTILLQPSVRA